MSDTPALDELPALVDEGLRLVEERIANSPTAQIYDSIKAQLTYVREVVHGERPRDAADDDRLLLNRYAAHELETTDPPFADVLFNVHYLYERWPTTETPAAAVQPLPARRRAVKRGNAVLVVIAALIIAATMIGSGVFLLVQSETGTRAVATVGNCETTGSGKYARTHCTGTWIVGGSLIEGGHVIWGKIDGADKRDVGKKIDVTLRGDTAYARGLALPLLLIALGFVPGVAVVLRGRALLRTRN